MAAQGGAAAPTAAELKPLVTPAPTGPAGEILSPREGAHGVLRTLARLMYDPLWVAMWLSLVFGAGLLGTSPLAYPLLHGCPAGMEAEADAMSLHHHTAASHSAYRPGDLGVFVAGISMGAVLIMVGGGVPGAWVGRRCRRGTLRAAPLAGAVRAPPTYPGLACHAWRTESWDAHV